MDLKQHSTESSMAIPIWAIVIIAIVVVVAVIVAFLFLKRRRNRSLSVDTIHRKEDEKEEKKSATTVGSSQTLVTQQKKQNSFMNIPPVPCSNHRQLEETTAPSHMDNNTNVITDKPASSFDESEYDYPPPDPPQEIKISLPLPPPSTSFFSDKMELDGSEQDLYDMYLSTKTKKNSSGNGFISIDLDSNNATTSNGPSFYSNAAANIQQKAATIRSSFIQSLRLQSKSNNRTSAQQMFSNNTTTVKHDTPKQSNESSRHQLSAEDKKRSDLNKNSSTITTDSNKTVIDMRNAMPAINNSTIAKPPLEKLNVTQITSSMIDDESPVTPNSNLQEPVRAAKQVIRSASRKTKSRSMIVDNDKPIHLINNSSISGDQPHNYNEKDERKAKQETSRFASIRGPRSSGEHMTITSGSMRRLVRESILFDDDSLPSLPLASSAAMASTKVSSKKSGGISAVDIAGWWESKNDTATTSPKKSDLITAEAGNSNNSLPLFQNISAGSNSSGAPNQYRASLSTSIFGTLSKSNGALLGEMNKDDNSGENGGVSRHNSFRRGTLSRNTLRNITANATNGVNRSLKGLFDHSSSSVNKVVPDDSQKTELDSEPLQIAIEEKTTIDPQQQEQQKQQYNSVRQKSIRSTGMNRPSLPRNYLPTSESSTKYALSDEASLSDELVQRTSIDNKSESKYTTQNSTASNKQVSNVKSQQEEVEESTKVHVPSNSVNNGEVDAIRRILQDTWISNVRESGSMFSIASDTDSIGTTSTQQSGLANSNPNKVNPRQQNQTLLTKSLLTQQVAKRASLLARTGINTEETGFVPQQGPEPSASFSSSTVRTMVPEGSNNVSEPINIRQNAITTNNGSNKIQESSYDNKNGSLSSSILASRFSTSPMDNSHSSPRNSSAESSRGHSRKSSGGNSAATALRISSGYSVNAKTWNGRAQKRSSRPSVTQLINDDENTPSTPDSIRRASPSEQDQYQSLGRASVNKRAFFSTMRKGQKNRGGIPWMMEEDEEDRTPAQIERDKYLGKP